MYLCIVFKDDFQGHSKQARRNIGHLNFETCMETSKGFTGQNLSKTEGRNKIVHLFLVLPQRQAPALQLTEGTKYRKCTVSITLWAVSRFQWPVPHQVSFNYRTALSSHWWSFFPCNTSRGSTAPLENLQHFKQLLDVL